MSVNWRLINEARQKNWRYDLPTKVHYRVLANKLAFLGKSKLAALALNAASHVNQLEDNDDGRNTVEEW